MKQKIVILFTWLVVFFTAFQGMIPTLPLTNEGTITLISAITMFLVSGLTVWKQALSKEINSEAILPTIVVASVATLGGLNELLDIFYLSDIVGQWLRFAITFITMGLNLISKLLYPTVETRSLL
jgi:hypothetical protein